MLGFSCREKCEKKTQMLRMETTTAKPNQPCNEHIYVYTNKFGNTVDKNMKLTSTGILLLLLLLCNVSCISLADISVRINLDGFLHFIKQQSTHDSFLLTFILIIKTYDFFQVEANPLNIKEHEDIKGRRLQTADCILLLKITTNIDHTESEEVDCYDPTTDTISKITTEYGDEIIQKQLVLKMNQ